MKIEQKPKFQPITITLETSEEADMFWEVIVGGVVISKKAKKFGIEISNWLSNNAQLGGCK